MTIGNNGMPTRNPGFSLPSATVTAQSTTSSLTRLSTQPMAGSALSYDKLIRVAYLETG